MRIIETDPVTRVLKYATYIHRQTHTHTHTQTDKTRHTNIHAHIQAHTHRHATMQWILFKYSRNRFKCFCNASVLLCKELFYYIFQRITISSSAEYDVTFHFSQGNIKIIFLIILFSFPNTLIFSICIFCSMVIDSDQT